MLKKYTNAARALLRVNVATARELRDERVSEEQLHKLVFDTMTILSNMKKLHCVWFPVPNGAADLGPKIGGLLKAKGKIKPGVSDFCFLGNGGSLCCELKTKTGRQNSDQIEFQGECDRAGVKYALYRSLDDVLAELVDADFLEAADAAMFATH